MNIYPSVHLSMHDSELVLTTLVRKLHEGVYYLWPVKHTVHEPKGFSIETILQHTGRLHHEAYKVIVFGVVQPDLKDQNGMLVFIPDLDQTPEIARVKNLLL